MCLQAAPLGAEVGAAAGISMVGLNGYAQIIELSGDMTDERGYFG